MTSSFSVWATWCFVKLTIFFCPHVGKVFEPICSWVTLSWFLKLLLCYGNNWKKKLVYSLPDIRDGRLGRGETTTYYKLSGEIPGCFTSGLLPGYVINRTSPLSVLLRIGLWLQKLEDALTAAKKLSSLRQMQLTKVIALYTILVPIICGAGTLYGYDWYFFHIMHSFIDLFCT